MDIIFSSPFSYYIFSNKIDLWASYYYDLLYLRADYCFSITHRKGIKRHITPIWYERMAFNQEKEKFSYVRPSSRYSFSYESVKEKLILLDTELGVKK